MSPEDREVIARLVEGQRTLTETTRQLSDALMQQIAYNAVLTAACGALYAEVANVAGSREALDEMLARFTGVVEANSDSLGHVLTVADKIRAYSESMFGDRD